MSIPIAHSRAPTPTVQLVAALARQFGGSFGAGDSDSTGNDCLDEPAFGRARPGVGLFVKKLRDDSRRSLHLSGYVDDADFFRRHHRRGGALGIYFRLVGRAHRSALQDAGDEFAEHRHSFSDLSQSDGLGIFAPPAHRRDQHSFDAAFRSISSAAQYRDRHRHRLRPRIDPGAPGLRDDFRGAAQHESGAGRSRQRARSESVAHAGAHRAAAHLAGAVFRGDLDVHGGDRRLRRARRHRHGE